MDDKFKPCKLNTYTDHYFITIENKRFIYDLGTQKVVRNRVLERDLKEEQYLEYEKKINEQMKKVPTAQNFMELDRLFLFTESYGDRNICHWMTEQLMVLNYMIHLMDLDDNLNEHSLCFHSSYPTILINKNRRESMRNMILDYVKSIPKLEEEDIIEYDMSGDMKMIRCKLIYLGDALDCNLDNIYSLWEQLHSRLSIMPATNSTSSKFYMSRRNIYQPGKHTNTRILENYEEISNTIVDAGYTEIFTDELESLGSRINLFKNADTIICELGAGVHNLLYCSEGTNVIIMYQKNNISWLEEYYPLFRHKKMNVKIIAGETTSPKHNGNWLNTPWKLYISDLKSVI